MSNLTKGHVVTNMKSYRREIRYTLRLYLDSTMKNYRILHVNLT